MLYRLHRKLPLCLEELSFVLLCWREAGCADVLFFFLGQML